VRGGASRLSVVVVEEGSARPRPPSRPRESVREEGHGSGRGPGAAVAAAEGFTGGNWADTIPYPSDTIPYPLGANWQTYWMLNYLRFWVAYDPSLLFTKITVYGKPVRN